MGLDGLAGEAALRRRGRVERARRLQQRRQHGAEQRDEEVFGAGDRGLSFGRADAGGGKTEGLQDGGVDGTAGKDALLCDGKDDRHRPGGDGIAFGGDPGGADMGVDHG